MYFAQGEYDIRCEWGIRGVETLAPICDAIVIVDVLSFSTCVDVAVSLGVRVYPYRWKDSSAQVFAKEVGAHLAGSRAEGGLSLSPVSLMGLARGDRLVLPSPNGSYLSVATGETATFAGCLRNAATVAEQASHEGPLVGVIPAGERWPDGSLRPSLEDWLGAGAIVAHLTGRKSPEAAAAEAAFRAVRGRLQPVIAETGSGREMVSQGYARDVEVACELLVSGCAPKLGADGYEGLPAKRAGR